MGERWRRVAVRRGVRECFPAMDSRPRGEFSAPIGSRGAGGRFCCPASRQSRWTDAPVDARYGGIGFLETLVSQSRRSASGTPAIWRITTMCLRRMPRDLIFGKRPICTFFRQRKISWSGTKAQECVRILRRSIPSLSGSVSSLSIWRRFGRCISRNPMGACCFRFAGFS